MARGIYVARLDATVVSTARTLIQINAPATAVLEILRMWVTQTLSETSTQEEIQILRTSTAGTGTSFTPILVSTGTSAAGATATNNHTAEGTAGDSIIREGFNIINGWYYLPIPEERIFVAPSARIALKFPVAPASATFTAGIVWSEIG